MSDSRTIHLPSRRIPVWKDTALLVAERLARQVYWSFPVLRRWRRSTARQGKPSRQECRRGDLLSYLSDIGVKYGALVMVHTGIDGVEILDERGHPQANTIAQAQRLLEDLVRLLGPDGTLVMPTNAAYQSEGLEPEPPEITNYDPRRTPCGVGLVNSLFLRIKGVKRSLFPFNMLAAHGPLADELLRDNLNERKPSAHGVDSGYYRICQRNGLVLSVGIPLRECITIAHAVEEVRADWPIKDFFVERRYRVVQEGVAKEWTVRLRRDDYAKFSHCRKKVGRDLVAEGVIHEGSVGSVRVDWARAGEVYDFFWTKTERFPYPYYGLWMIGKTWRTRP